MDFKLILLLASVGLLVMVAVFALIGFFSGLKKELKCSVIALVLLLITILVFGNSSILLNMNGEFLKNILTKIPASAHTVWECILGFARNSVENGAKIFAEGTESYNFLYNVTSAACRGILLIIGVIGILVIIFIVNVIYRIVSAVRAKKRGQENPQDQTLPDTVVVDQNAEGERKGTVIVTDTQLEPEKKASKHRGWGAFVAAVRAIIIIFILFMPVGGLGSVLKEVTPETEQLIKDVLNGDTKKTATSQTDQLVDMAMDFTDAYYDSIIGKIVESPAYFFNESLSAKLFDRTFVVDSKNGAYPLRGEVKTFLRAINALNGQLDTANFTQEEVNAAVDALKDSHLLVDVLPVVIEFAYYTPINDSTIFKGKTLGDLLFAANQQAAFLALRQENWKQNLDAILETVKDAYALGVTKSDFNYLLMDPEIMHKAADHITDAPAVSKLLNILLLTGVNHEMFTSRIGKLDQNPDLSNFDWKKELSDIVDIYDRFLDLGITTLKDVDTNALIEDILNDDQKFDAVADILASFTDLQLFRNVMIQVLTTYVSNQDIVKDSGTDLVQSVKDLANVNWHDDVVKYLEAVRIALNEDVVTIGENLKVDVDYLHLDVDALREIVDKLFETESLEKILPIATKIVIASNAFKNLIGDEKVTINTADIKWKDDFTTLLDIYEEFLGFEIESTDEFNNVMDLLKKILADDAKADHLEAIVDKLTDLSLADTVIIPVADAVATNKLGEKVPEVVPYVDLASLTKEELKEDLNNLIKALEDVYDATELDFNLANLELNDEFAEAMKDALHQVLNLNLLGDDENLTGLVNGILEHFKPFGEDVDVELVDLDWDKEELALQALVDQLVALQGYEGFDLPNKQFDYNTLLTNDDFLDEVVTTLEVLVDSDAFLQLLPTLLDKYVVPAVADIDDDNTVQDILDSLTSEELVQEVEKLIDVVKAIVKLNVLAYKDEGINAIHFNETDAMHTIIDGILDSKIMEGFEGRIIRLLLKATKIFPDLEKGVFDGIDWDREQVILNSIVEDLKVLLVDDRLVILNEDGKFVFNTDLYLSDEVLNGFKQALDDLFGTWELDGTETEGSELVARLYPELIDKFIDKVPADFSELVEISGIKEQSKEDLASDVRHLIYVLKQALDIDVQNYIADKDYDFSHTADAINNILDALFDMHCVAGKENKLVSWAVNYAIDKAKLDVEKTTEDTFAGVDWDVEVEAIKALVSDVIGLLVDNHINTISKVKSFINDKGYNDKAYYTTVNANKVLNILEDIAALQTVDSLLPTALDFALKKADDKGFDFTFLGENMTGELLAEDLMSIIQMARIAVNRLDIVTLYKDNWEGNLPAVEHVLTILDIFWDLNLLENREGKFIQVLIDKYLKENNYLHASDFELDDLDMDSEWPVLREALAEAYKLFELNNLKTIGDVKAFVKDQDYKQPSIINDTNLNKIADVLEILGGSEIVSQALVAFINNVVELEMVTKYGDYTALKDYTKEYAKHDIPVLAQLIRDAVSAKLLQYFTDKDLDPIHWQEISELVRDIPELILVKDFFSALLPSGLNYVTSNVIKNFTVTHEYSVDDFEGTDWVEEFNLIADIVLQLDDLFTPHNLDSISDLIKFAKNMDFLNPIFATQENADKAIAILDNVVESKLVEAGAYIAIDFGIYFAEQKNYDVSFLQDHYTGPMVVEDLKTLVDILKLALDFGAVEYYQTNDIAHIDTAILAEIVGKLEELNILTVDDVNRNWAALAMNEIVKRLNRSDLQYKAEDFEEVDFASENLLAQQFVNKLGELLANENLESVSEIKAFINNKTYQEYNVYSDEALFTVKDLLLLLSDSDLASFLLPIGLDFAADKVTQVDLSFIKGRFTREDLAHDLGVLAGFVDYAVAANAVDLVFTLETPDKLSLAPLADLVADLEDLNLLTKDNINREWSALVFNYISDTVKLVDKFTAEDFAEVDYAEENALLVNAIKQLNLALGHLNIEKVVDAKGFINNKDYMKQDFYTLDVLYDLDYLVDQAVASKLLQVGLPTLFEYGLDKVMNMTGLDLEFLSNTLDGAELANDIRVLADDAIFLIQNTRVLELIETKVIPFTIPSDIRHIVASLESINTLKVNQAKLATELTNYVLSKVLKVELSVTVEDFSNITSWADENLAVQHVLDAVQDLFIEFILPNEIDTIDEYKNIPNLVKESPRIITNNVALAFADVLKALGISKFVQSILPVGFEYGLKIATQMTHLDLDFLKDQFNGEELGEDLGTIGDIIVDLVAMDILDLVIDRETPNELTLAPLASAAAKLEDLNLLTKNDLNRDWSALAFNKVSEILKLSDRFVASDFNDVDYAAENALLVNAIKQLNLALDHLGFKKVADIKEFVQTNKDYMNQDIYTLDVLYDFDYLVDQAVASKLVQIALPVAFEFGLDKVMGMTDLDLEFLSGQLDGAELANDLRVVADDAIFLIQNTRIFELIKTKNIPFTIPSDLKHVVASLESINTLKVDQTKLAVELTNFVAEKFLKYSGRVTELDFKNVTNWAEENETIQAVLDEVQNLFLDFIYPNEIVSLDDYKGLVNKIKEDPAIVTDDVVLDLAAILKALSVSNFAASELVFGESYLISFLESKGYDIANALVTPSEMSADLFTLGEFIEKTVVVNLVAFLTKNDVLDQAYVESFANAAGALVNLNVLDNLGVREELIRYALNNFLKLEIDEIVVSDWAHESQFITNLILDLNEATLQLDRLTISQLKKLKDVNELKSYLKFSEKTNDQLDVIASLLGHLSESELVHELLLPLSEKFLNNEKLAGFADFHNIYNDAADAQADLADLALVVLALKNLDLYNVVTTKDSDIPYGNLDDVETIIKKLFALNYLNLPGRVDTLLGKAAEMTKMDALNDINGNNINLAADGELLYNAYYAMTTFFNDPNWFLKNVDDLQNMRILLKDWSDIKYRLALKYAFHDVIDTTMVQETNGLIILLIAFPLIQKSQFGFVLDALDIENYSSADAHDDFNSLTGLVDTILDSNLTDILNGAYFSTPVKNILVDAVSTLRDLKLLAGHGNDLAQAFLDHYDGKLLNGYEIDGSKYDLASVDFYADSAVLIDMIETAYDFFANNSIVTMDDMKAFVNPLKIEKLLTEDNMNSILDLVDEVVSLTLVEFNGLPLYSLFLEGRIVKFDSNLEDLAHLEDVYSTNPEFYQDLLALREVIRDARDYGIVEIVQGEKIPYERELIANKFFLDLAEVKYLNEKIVDIVEYLKVKLPRLELDALDVSGIQFAHDMEVLSRLYSALIPALISSKNPVQTIDDVKNISKLRVQKGFIYDYQLAYVEALNIISELSIAPQIVKFAVNKVSPRLSGRALDIINILDIENMDNDELRADIVTLADAIAYQVNVDILGNRFYGNEIKLDGKNSVLGMVEAIFNLHLVDNNMEDLVRYLVENILSVDLTGVDLSTVAWENEQDQILVTLDSALDAIYSVDVTTLNGLKTYLKDSLSSIKNSVKDGIELIKDKHYKTGAKEILHSVTDVLKDADGTAIVDMLTSAFDLQLLAKLGLPVYLQKVYEKLTGLRQLVGDIHDYDEALFTADLQLLKTFVSSLYRSEIHKVLTDHVLVKEGSNIALLQDAVRALANLEIVDIKVQDFGPILDNLVQRIPALANIVDKYASTSLANLDTSSLSFKLDSDQYAEMVPFLYDILTGYMAKGVTGAFFGETYAINGFVQIYELSLDTTLGDIVYPRILTVVRKLAAKANVTVSDDTEAVYDNIAVFLEGLLDLGIFSNNGFDFTKVATVNAMRTALYDSAELPSRIRKLLDAVINRIYHFGLIPFTWESVELRKEFDLMKTNGKELLNIIKDNLSEIKNGNVSFLADSNVQTKITDIAQSMLDSSFVQQLGMPLIEGLFRAFTITHYDGVMEHSATLQDVVDYFLPDMFAIFDAMMEVNGLNLKAKASLYAFGAYADIVDIAFQDILLKDNLDALLATIMAKYGEQELTDAEKTALANLDWDAERVIIVDALHSLEYNYIVEPFELRMDNLNDTTLYALADAIEILAPSQIIAQTGTAFMKLLARKVIAKSNQSFADEIIERIENDDYNNAKIVADVALLPTFLRSAADAHLFNPSDDYSTWDFDAARSTIHCLFNLYLLETRQSEIIDAIFERIPFVKSNYDPETMIVTDWENELTQIVNTLEAVIDCGLTDFNTPIDDLAGHGEIFMAAKESVILKKAFLNKINSNLVANGLTSYEVTEADIDAVDTVEKWNKEIDALQTAHTLIEEINNGTRSTSNPVDLLYIKAVYDDVKANSYIGNKCLRAALEEAGVDPALLD